MTPDERYDRLDHYIEEGRILRAEVAKAVTDLRESAKRHATYDDGASTHLAYSLAADHVEAAVKRAEAAEVEVVDMTALEGENAALRDAIRHAHRACLAQRRAVAEYGMHVEMPYLQFAIDALADALTPRAALGLTATPPRGEHE